MRKLIPLLFLFCCAPLRAADCPGSSDACSAGRKVKSPFLEAAAAPAADKKKAAAPVQPVSTAPAAASAPAQEAPAASPAPETFSSPLWLLFIAAVVAAVYFYLAAGGKKRKKR